MNTKTKELDLGTIFSLLFKNSKYIILTILICVIVSVLFTKLVIDPKYKSSISIYITNSTEIANNNLNINDINASQKLVDTCVVILKNDEILSAVSESLREKYSIDDLDKYLGVSDVNGKQMVSPQTLRETISMSSVNSTQILEIRVLTKNAQLSHDICAQLAKIAPDTLTSIVKVGSANPIGSATLNSEPSSPNVIKNTLIFGLLGLVLSAGFILLRFSFDTTIKREDDIKELFDIAVLGEIPDLSSK